MRFEFPERFYRVRGLDHVAPGFLELVNHANSNKIFVFDDEYAGRAFAES